MRWLVLCTVLLAVTACNACFVESLYEQIKWLFLRFEEPPSTVTRKLPGYEERVYDPMKWVCSQETHTNDTVMTGMFHSLFCYISGENESGERINMTAPVTTEYSVRIRGDKTYTMCFFLGRDHQEDPPRPTNPRVFIQERPEIRILTRTVGGYLENEREWLEEAGKLAAIIAQQGESVNLNHMYWAGYDPPFKFWYRRNEVWFPVADSRGRRHFE